MLQKTRHPAETAIAVLLGGAAFVSASITLVILLFFVRESLSFFAEPGFSLVEFLTETEWRPAIDDFGIWPVLIPTMVVALIAVTVAMPLGISIAILLNEYSHPRLRAILKPTLEVFAGVPTVVFAYFALTRLTPALQRILGAETVEPYNLLSAGITVGLLVMPVVFTMLDERFSRIPRYVREAPLSIGATRFEAFRKTVLPASQRTIRAAFLLTFSRAVGESMIVSLAAGSGTVLTANPLRGAETMTGYIVRISRGDMGFGTIDYTSIFALATVLYLITIAGIFMSRRWK